MGAHESNRGLCQALLRAFFSADCHRRLETVDNAAANVGEAVPDFRNCEKLTRLLRDRDCQVPDDGELVPQI